MYCTNSLLLKLHCCAYQAMFILESVYQLWYAVVTDFRTNTCLISITGDHYLLLTCGQYVRYGHFDLDSPQQGGQAYQSFSILAGFWSTDDNWWLLCFQYWSRSLQGIAFVLQLFTAPLQTINIDYLSPTMTLFASACAYLLTI